MPLSAFWKDIGFFISSVKRRTLSPEEKTGDETAQGVASVVLL